MKDSVDRSGDFPDCGGGHAGVCGLRADNVEPDERACSQLYGAGVVTMGVVPPTSVETLPVPRIRPLRV
jgi:hypothetical protein